MFEVVFLINYDEVTMENMSQHCHLLIIVKIT